MRPYEGIPANLLLQTEPAARMVYRGRLLKRKTKGVHVQLFCGSGGIVGGDVQAEGPHAVGFLKVVAKESELYIRHNEPIQR